MNFEDLAFLFTCDNRNRGIIRLNFDEAALLWKSVRNTKGPILEIGRRHGGSTMLLAMAGGDRMVTSVDIDPAHHPVADAFFRRPEVARRLDLVIADSRVPRTGRIGFAFVDGDHTYEGVAADVAALWDNLIAMEEAVPLVAFHDAVPNPGLEWAGQINHCPGVEAVCKELVQGGCAESESAAGSMLVLRKTGPLPANFGHAAQGDNSR